MKLYKVTVVTSEGTIHECFIIAGNGTEAGRIAEEETDLDIDYIKGVQHWDLKNPMLICEIDVTDK